MNATEFCEHVENTLGWEPTVKDGDPKWKRYMVEAAKLNRKVKSDKDLYTWDNLLLTVEWLRRKRKATTPTGVCWHVEKALKEAAVPDPLNDHLTALVFSAITEAMVAGEPDWVEKLARATGSARTEALTDWKTFKTLSEWASRG